MAWNTDYQQHKHLWGQEPSILASFMVGYQKASLTLPRAIDIIDIGCGYGRDDLYLSLQLNCTVMGVDNSAAAIKMAVEACQGRPNVCLKCCDFALLPTGYQYDVVYASNVYQILSPAEREKLKDITKTILKPGGRLFLSTLSVSDPQHGGRGIPVDGDPNSVIDGKYVHLTTKTELEAGFSFVNIRELKELSYDEPRATGETHHHISWVLVGQRA